MLTKLNIILFIYYVFAKQNFQDKMINKNNQQMNNKHVFLTDMVNTHFQLPYLNTDQCMLRQGQKKLGSYGLIFERPFFYLCDELLICYPSQLIGNNRRNGIVTTVPYRLREAKKNNVTLQCEQRRKEFCNEEKNKNLCKIGQPGSTIWHGILIKTENKNQTLSNSPIFVTTILLSITKQKYEIKDTLKFYMKFGRMEDIFTRVILNNDTLKSKQVFLGSDKNLLKEYLSKVDKGASLHKYVGLWALGLDLLPTLEEQHLHLFVYRGCACSINVWFKTPTIPESTKPEITPRLETGYKNCSAKYPDNTYELGNLKDEEKIIKFSIRAINNGSSAAFAFFNAADMFLEINFRGREIIFYSYMHNKIPKPISKFIDSNLLDFGTSIDLTIRISNYYVWILFESNVFVKFIKKLWPDDWWNGKFLNKTKLKILISGDFILAAPIFIRVIDEQSLDVRSF
uniref:Uncharacterized protein n=1 Tax=Meloidogyne enterolobii TaxID=390850 RepID=A0A6V7W6J7_MELEN|nr:unnamed protein product [Meloidogyne enterolobii]